jgi:beta-lactamase regulating signal transducer with metallopeptidase domain
VVAIWLTGAGAGLAFLFTGLIRLRRLASRSIPMGEPWPALAQQICRDYAIPRPIRLLQSRNTSVLVTWGVVRAKVLLPQSASSWPANVANVVLRHELAHVRRCDWITQMIAQLLRIVYWFNPLIWIVCRRLRLEAELACDDAVLLRNINGHEYASHLLDLARSLNTTNRAWSAVLTMARPSTLERRFAAMLNPELNRNPLGRSAMLTTLLIGLGITALLPAMNTSAAPGPAVQAQVKPALPAIATVLPAPQARSQTASRPALQLPETEAEQKQFFEQLATEAAKVSKEVSEQAVGLEKLEWEKAMAEVGKEIGNISWTVPKAWMFPPFRQDAGGMSGESAGMLIKLFDSTNDPDMKDHILSYLGMSSTPQAAEKVLALARSAADKDLQKKAIDFIAFRPNAFDELASIFDSSKDTDTRKHILAYLGMSRDPRASQKLFSIAQSDPDPDVRRDAVDYIALR